MRFVVSLFFVSTFYGQILPPTTTVERTSAYIQPATVQPGSSPTTINLVVDTQPSGGDQIEIVTSDPGIVVSLVTPSGMQVTAATAASLGISWTTSSANDNDYSDFLDPFSIPGTHTSIELPAGSVSGMYQVVADGRNIENEAGILIQYFSPSLVVFGAATDSASYRVGESVTLAGFLSDGAMPIQNASVTAEAYYASPVSASISNFQLISQQDLGDGTTSLTYSAQINNSGFAANGVVAAASSNDPSVSVDSGNLFSETSQLTSRGQA